MRFDFDTPVERRNSGSAKWNHYGADVLPMWVADMDFRSADPILKALRERVEHGVFGYGSSSPELVDVLCERMQRMYNWRVTPEEIVFVPGIVSGMNVACRAYGKPGGSSIMLTPMYPPFFTAPTNNGMTCTSVPLTLQRKGQTIDYAIDFDAFEAAITPQTSVFLHCHPHNPTGHEYTRDELLRLGEICLKHNIVIASDEIHCELMMGGNRHTPTAAVSPEIAERTVTLMAPSKTFNRPGLGFGFAIIQNKQLRDQFNSASMGIVPHNNVLGVSAALAAYRDSDEWLQALLKYLTANRDTLVDYVHEYLPGVATTVPQATYLAWLDCRAAGIKGNPYEFCLVNARVACNDGATFGPDGAGFLRFNFGCPRSQMMQALDQIKDALGQLQPA